MLFAGPAAQSDQRAFESVGMTQAMEEALG